MRVKTPAGSRRTAFALSVWVSTLRFPSLFCILSWCSTLTKSFHFSLFMCLTWLWTHELLLIQWVIICYNHHLFCCSNCYSFGNLLKLVLICFFLPHTPITHGLSVLCLSPLALKLQDHVDSGPWQVLLAFQLESDVFFSVTYGIFSAFSFTWPLPGRELVCNGVFSFQEIHQYLYYFGISAQVLLKSLFPQIIDSTRDLDAYLEEFLLERWRF